MKLFFFPFKTEPTGTLDVWYMRQHIDYNRQQISLFWKVSLQCPLKIQENYRFGFFVLFLLRYNWHMKRITYLNDKFQGQKKTFCFHSDFGMSLQSLCWSSFSQPDPHDAWFCVIYFSQTRVRTLTSCLHTITSFPHPLPVRSRFPPIPEHVHPLTPLSTPSLLIHTICPTVTMQPHLFICGEIKAVDV